MKSLKRRRFLWKSRRWRLRHPCDRNDYSEWELLQIAYWTNGCSCRRHHEPFAKTQRGRFRRSERLFVLKQKEASS